MKKERAMGLLIALEQKYEAIAAISEFQSDYEELCEALKIAVSTLGETRAEGVEESL